MRKLYVIVAMVVAMLIASCNFVQVDQSQSIALQIVAKRVGYYVGKSNPEIVPIVKIAAQGIVGADSESSVIKSALNTGIEELAKQFPNDPLLESDLKLIMSALKINVPDSTVSIEQVRPLITAFIEGLDISAISR